MTIATTTRPDECAGERVVGDEQSRRRARERQLARAVDRERHAARHDKRGDQPARQRDERARDQRVLRERLREVEVEGDHGECLMGDGDARGVR